MAAPAASFAGSASSGGQVGGQVGGRVGGQVGGQVGAEAVAVEQAAVGRDVRALMGLDLAGFWERDTGAVKLAALSLPVVGQDRGCRAPPAPARDIRSLVGLGRAEFWERDTGAVTPLPPPR